MAFEVIELPPRKRGPQKGTTAAAREVKEMLGALQKQPGSTARSDLPSGWIRYYAKQLGVAVTIETDKTYSYVRLKSEGADHGNG